MQIVKVEKGSENAAALLEFVRHFSWVDVQEHMTEKLEAWDFTDWEAAFAAKDGEKIVGMAYLLKTDYYPLPEIFPWVTCLFVSEEVRGRGLCGQLIDCANRYAASLGFARTYIPTEHTGVFEKYGYRFLREITNYGGGVDRLLAKELKGEQA